MANITESVFENNFGSSQCSNLNVSGFSRVYLQNVNIVNTLCTGISLFSTPLYVLNSLNLSNNSGVYGGGIELRALWRFGFSQIFLNKTPGY